MLLVVKKAGQTVNELRFGRGPVYIGRHAHSQVLLPERAVSRQHAAIFSTPEGKWMVEDLDSANKTYLNDKAIHKAEIKTGDCIRIGDFDIEVDLEIDAGAKGDINLEDTLVPDLRPPVAGASAREIVVRNPQAERGPDIRLPAKRIKDFLQATEAICKSNGPDEVLKTLLTVTLSDFRAYHSWCALRNVPEGPMTCHAGKGRAGRAVELADIKLHDRITHAIDKMEFVLIPRASSPTDEVQVRSAMIAPIIDPSGCFGVLYVDNAMDHEHYNLSDMDYLMLLAIHTAAVVENF
ncbi:MAG: FHA domain-containing protein [Phycisphaerales bacterium]|nr:MAG: FHA domain-containing protein [Phycisphaerales bacterium]